MYNSAIDFYHKYYFVIDQSFVVRSGQNVQHYVKGLVGDLRQVSGFLFSESSSFVHQWNWPTRYNWNSVESGFKHIKQMNKHKFLPLSFCI